jgi:hypothetical protein
LKAQRGIEVYSFLTSKLVKAKLRAFYPWENSPLPILEEGGWIGFGASYDGNEEHKVSCPHRSSNARPTTCSELLYGLGYPGGPSVKMYKNENIAILCII